MADGPDHHAQIITQTMNWIRNVVIGCNFCPFAASEVKRNSIHLQVEASVSKQAGKDAFVKELLRLDEDHTIETTLLIFPHMFGLFQDYLDYVFLMENLLRRKGYRGKYQLASFHPLYQFEGTSIDDAVNYTNRSVYPMVHLLREDSISKALLRYPDPKGIPERNIDFTRRKGVAYMKMLRDSCL